MSKSQYHENQKRRSVNEYDRLSNAELYLSVCGIEHFSPDSHYGPKTLPNYSLSIVLSGEGSVVINGREMKNLHSGQMFLIRPNDVIELFPNPDHPWTYCWVTFDGNRANAAMEDAGFKDGIALQNCYVDIFEFFRLTEQILSHPEVNESARLWRHGVLCQFIALAIESNRRNPRNASHKNIDQKHSRQSYIDHAVEFINNNYAVISIEDVSSYLGIHRSYLSKLFREQIGCTPNDYLLRRRMTRSAQLLVHTELSIREIGETVGYEDPLTFSKAFKRYYNISPKFYRRLPESERKELAHEEE